MREVRSRRRERLDTTADSKLAEQGLAAGVRLRVVAIGVAIAGAYYGSATLGFELSVAQGVITPVWPPAGLALASLLLLGPRYWPAIAAAGVPEQRDVRRVGLGRRRDRSRQHDRSARGLRAAAPAALPAAARPGTRRGVLIGVDDNGRGVPDAQKQTIFDLFSRGADPNSPGAGIGLALVSQFVALQGGRVWVEDSPSGGASFRVLLPARTLPAAR